MAGAHSTRKPHFILASALPDRQYPLISCSHQLINLLMSRLIEGEEPLGLANGVIRLKSSILNNSTEDLAIEPHAPLKDIPFPASKTTDVQVFRWLRRASVLYMVPFATQGDKPAPLGGGFGGKWRSKLRGISRGGGHQSAVLASDEPAIQGAPVGCRLPTTSPAASAAGSPGVQGQGERAVRQSRGTANDVNRTRRPRQDPHTTTPLLLMQNGMLGGQEAV
ncbi:hypothetical protein AAFF_G00285740 [Aldrovandia affinis]|uniref:Uncharacterized protein n=1 Tax=Aldrovandia affinis TaxID=143900 RepID=A0AAD7TAF7_9TELE|nr:hypothetical protein AAFF_G00285740 [Aldrovandia affinis]